MKYGLRISAKSSALKANTELNLYYEEGIAVKSVDGTTTDACLYSLSSGPKYGSNLVSMENIGEYEGKQNVYKYTATGTDIIRILGVDNAYITENGINSVSMKLFIPAGIDSTLIYGTIYTDGGTHGMRLNSGNMGGSYLSQYFALYDAEGARITELAEDDYGTWVTLVFELTGIQNNANAALVGGGLNAEFTLKTTGTIYFADVQFGTNAVDVYTAA